MASISLRGVRRTHPDGTAALDGVDLDVADGELFGVIGPSGSGKSTLLRVVAGLEPVAAGVVEVDGRDVRGVPPRGRDLALIAQSRGLYAFLDVAENLAFPLEVRGLGAAEVQRRTAAERDALGLAGVWHRRPRQLSAGDAQRAAIARSMVRLPRALLADEPLQLLDPPTAVRLREELRRLQRATRMTTVWTTNDHGQVLGIADRVAVLRAGRIAQVAAPAELLDRPVDRWVAGFVGDHPMAVVEAVVEDEGGIGWLRLGAQRLRVPGGLPGPLRERRGSAVLLGARPGVCRAAEPGDRAEARLAGRVVAGRSTGAESVLEVDVGAGHLTARFPGAPVPPPGAAVEVHVAVRRTSVFDPVDGRAVWHGGG